MRQYLIFETISFLSFIICRSSHAWRGNFTFSDNGVDLCRRCNKEAKYGGLCNCTGWQDTKRCSSHQMMCKKRCGVCLPNLIKTARTWPKCYDHNDDCKHYAKYGYCNVYRKWMAFLCKYSCGHCDKCVDEDAECEGWKDAGLCDSMKDYMLVHCRKSCNVCECYDHNIHCKIWADNRQCESNAPAMELRCPLSCGICGVKETRIPEIIMPEDDEFDEELFETSSQTTTEFVRNTVHLATKPKTTLSTQKKTTQNIDSSTSSTFTERSSTLQPSTKLTTTTTTTWATTSEARTTFATSLSSILSKTTSTGHIIHNSTINDVHCGVLDGTRFRRIVGGDELRPPGSWPWIVGITSSKNPERVDCGGSLLTNEFILTAAHCFARPGGMDPNMYTVRLGEHHLNKNEGVENFVKIDKIFVHQLYNTKTYDYDIAVARLQKPITWTSKIRTACIAEFGTSIPPGEICFVAGWGFKAEGLPGPPELTVAKVPIVDWNECNLKYGLVLETVTERMLCCSGDGNADSCEGDSGGPLVCRKEDGNFMQVGIVSWGVGCNRKNLYGVYTDVAKQRKWLDELVDTQS